MHQISLLTILLDSSSLLPFLWLSRTAFRSSERRVVFVAKPFFVIALPSHTSALTATLGLDLRNTHALVSRNW
ncbi:hypothetical protein ARMSODRAFT_753189 [Armillaria solidipes]|uniref:Uncharacterized protein n=1 Tax=Armillaria solidipes TaxID=1076256 RepID=A0A2H3BTR1_9AGAR|nr:hypothetical protein ARMSODRAFT_753189 [Armillaria solidipes]